MISNVKLKKPVNSTLSKTAISLSGIGVLSPGFARQFETHISEIIANSGKLLRVVIQNKIAIVKPAYKRNKKWFGVKINRIFKVDSEYIELSGIELLAIIKLLKKDIGKKIYPKSTYLIPFGEAERILTKLKDIKKCC